MEREKGRIERWRERKEREKGRIERWKERKVGLRDGERKGKRER